MNKSERNVSLPLHFQPMKLNFWYEFKCIDVKVECGEAKTTYFQTFVKLFNLCSALPIFLQSLLLSLHVALDMLASFEESPNVGARFEKLLKLLYFVISVKYFIPCCPGGRKYNFINYPYKLLQI